MLPALQEFRELEENDRKRSGLKSNLTMAQGQRYNDGKNGKFNINGEVLPYDQTRVKLKTPINGIDYINAAWIQRITESNPYEDVYEFLPAAKMNSQILVNIFTKRCTSNTLMSSYMYAQIRVYRSGTKKRMERCTKS